jgi:type I restriction enzyme M protein
MTNNSAQIVQKLWNYCHVLRDDGLSYGDYVEQLTYLLFLKMAHERAQPPWTRTLWIYDLRTNKNFTLKTNPLQRTDLDVFVTCCNPERRHERAPTWSEATPEGRWRSYPYEELLQRDKVSLDIFWLRDESLEDSANLPDPDVLAAEIAEDLQAALDQFALIAQDLGAERSQVPL